MAIEPDAQDDAQVNHRLPQISLWAGNERTQAVLSKWWVSDITSDELTLRFCGSLAQDLPDGLYDLQINIHRATRTQAQ